DDEKCVHAPRIPRTCRSRRGGPVPARHERRPPAGGTVRYCDGMTTTTFKDALRTGAPQVGMFTLEFATTGIGVLAAQGGADWILYDLEHTGWSLDDVRTSLAVSRRLDIASFVRVAGHRKDLVSTALDAGAEGIMKIGRAHV